MYTIVVHVNPEAVDGAFAARYLNRGRSVPHAEYVRATRLLGHAYRVALEKAYPGAVIDVLLEDGTNVIRDEDGCLIPRGSREYDRLAEVFGEAWVTWCETYREESCE